MTTVHNGPCIIGHIIVVKKPVNVYSTLETLEMVQGNTVHLLLVEKTQVLMKAAITCKNLKKWDPNWTSVLP